VENIEESNRKIRKDIGEEINEALYSLTLPHKLMGGVGPSLQIVPKRPKINTTMGQ